MEHAFMAQFTTAGVTSVELYGCKFWGWFDDMDHVLVCVSVWCVRRVRVSCVVSRVRVFCVGRTLPRVLCVPRCMEQAAACASWQW